MKTMVKTVIALCLLAAAILFHGCSSPKEVVTIRYAAWNLGSLESNGLERRMIKAFMEAHPNIKVEIDESFVTNYNTAMKAAAAANTIPDVFMYASIPQANTNGWCSDISQIVAKDNEWGNIPVSIRESAQIKDKNIAIPSAIYFFGYFCNEDLLKSFGIEVPATHFQIDDFRSIIEKTTDITHRSIGLADESNIIDWYPAAANPLLGWYTWDGGKFSLDSREFIDGVKLCKSICDKRQVFTLLSEDEKKLFKCNNDWEAWSSGTVALKFDGTWVVSDYSKMGFKMRFLGIPGGRACIVPDFLFISKNCKNPSEAYEFAKFMSAYSREGFSKRLDIAKTNHLTVSTIPMVKDKRLVDAYFSTITIDGIREVYNNMQQNSFVEGTKVLPGYSEARWDYSTSIKIGDVENSKIGDVIINAYKGKISIEDVAGQLNSAANECIQIYPRPADN